MEDYPKVILICGKKRSGKDTLANYIVNKYCYYKLSLADTLKKMIIDLIYLFYKINIPKKLLYSGAKDDVGYNIEFRGRDRYIKIKKKDINKITNLNRNVKEEFITLRYILQNVGTDICRNYLSDDIWSIVVDNKIKKLEIDNNNIVRVVIPDCRFENEYNYFKKRYNTLGIKIIRSDKDEVLHCSEKIDFETDHILYNNRSVDHLYKSFDEIITKKDNNIYENKINMIQI
jgi:hypothetical protein